MNEQSPLLYPPSNAPSVVVHQVQHDATAQMGLCCAGDNVRTNTVCAICNEWICRSHSRTHKSNDEIIIIEHSCIPCLSEPFMKQHYWSPVCPNCEAYEERPKHSFYINTKGKVTCVGLVVIVIIIVVAVMAN